MSDNPDLPASPMQPPAAAASQAEYQVLARKYRPNRFEDVVGQSALVRTLSNAIAAGRVAQAFILTGVRGVGKTTTARLIARALNCTGEDGQGGPTVTPCGVCDNCRAIAEGRHVDVQEIDAASHTGVDNIREVIDSVRYRPVQARYKIYIVDEVHMLSTAAFNALLKTLEEPPEHVKFIFATTEIRKVPVTILSRCQRFDLKRLEPAALAGLLGRIAAAEGVEVEDGAMQMLVRAAEGSARDGISLLDQAIAHGAGRVREADVRDMLGLADQALVADLFDYLMGGKAAQALSLLRDMYESGADPLIVLQDLLEFCHWLSMLKVAPDAPAAANLPEAERERATAMATALSVPVLTQSWQILLNGLDEARRAPQPLSATEMVLIRLCHAADLPDPGELVKKLLKQGTSQAAASAPAAGDGAGSDVRAMAPSGPDEAPSGGDGGQVRMQLAAAPSSDAPAPSPQSFEQVVALFQRMREAKLGAHLINDVHLVSFSPGRIEIQPGTHAPPNLANQVGQALSEWTGERWVVVISTAQGQRSLGEQRREEEERRRAEIAAHPLIKAVFEAFEGAEITQIRDLGVQLPADVQDEEQE